jgi:hypothetical protein
LICGTAPRFKIDCHIYLILVEPLRGSIYDVMISLYLVLMKSLRDSNSNILTPEVFHQYQPMNNTIPSKHRRCSTNTNQLTPTRGTTPWFNICFGNYISSIDEIAPRFKFKYINIGGVPPIPTYEQYDTIKTPEVFHKY